MPSYRTVSLSELTPGSILMTPVFDAHMAKLLDAGVSIDEHLIDRLKALGVTEVVVESAIERIVKRRATPLPSGVSVRSKCSTAQAIERCSNCGNVISIQPPAPDTKATAWLCKWCGAIYFGGDVEDAERFGVSRGETSVDSTFVVPIELKVDATGAAIPPENVQRLVKSLVPGEYGGPDRRIHKRHPVIVPVVALPLASDFRIKGEPIQMTTANVSLGGAALIHSRFIDSPYLALDFTTAGVELLQVVLKVLRVKSIGLVYEIGGEFISRLSQVSK
jgi:hypothetical protein